MAVEDAVHAGGGDVLVSDDGLQGGDDLLVDGPVELGLFDLGSEESALDPPDEVLGGLVPVFAGAPDAGASAELLGLVRRGLVLVLSDVSGQLDAGGALVGDVSGDVEVGDAVGGGDEGVHVPEGDVEGGRVGVDAGADRDVAELVVRDGLVLLGRSDAGHDLVGLLEVEVHELLGALEGHDADGSVEGDLEGLEGRVVGDGLEGLLHLPGVGEGVGDGLGDALGVHPEGDLGDDGEPSGGGAQGLDEVVPAHVVADLVESGLEDPALVVDGDDVVDAVLDGAVLEGADSRLLGVDPVLDGGVSSGGDDADGESGLVDGLHEGVELASGLGFDGHVLGVDVDDAVHLGHVDEDAAVIGVGSLLGEGGHGASVGEGARDGGAELIVVGGGHDDPSVLFPDLGAADEGGDVLDSLLADFDVFDVLH